MTATATKPKKHKFCLTWKNSKGEIKSYGTDDQRKALRKLFMLRHKTSSATNIKKTNNFIG
jgi:hypothetical protein